MNVAQGDVITTTCKWNNTTDRLVHWGENTEDEMCFNYTAYYPDLGLNWVSGSLNPICNTSLGD